MPEGSEPTGILFAPEATTTRVHTVSTKLNAQELSEFNLLAEKRGVSSGELLRHLFREALERGDEPLTATPELEEIVGVRILLLTLLKPLLMGKQLTPEAIDTVNATAKQMKKEVAAALVAGKQDGA